MKKITFLFITMMILTLNSKSQTIMSNNVEIETKAFGCLTSWMSSKSVDWKSLKSGFETYFQQASITKSTDSIDKQYWDILSFFQHPTKKFPFFKEKKNVQVQMGKLGLDNQSVMMKKQLDCYMSTYNENKSKLDSTSAFAVFGEIISAVADIPDVSPGIVASGLKYGIQQKDLKNELFQLTVVMLFYFDMSIKLSDGTY